MIVHCLGLVIHHDPVLTNRFLNRRWFRLSKQRHQHLWRPAVASPPAMQAGLAGVGS